MFKLVEKTNHNAVHGIFDALHRAERHLKEVIPTYVAKSYFSDKTLTVDSFMIIPHVRETPQPRRKHIS